LADSELECAQFDINSFLYFSFNDWTASRLIRKNKGVFEAEMRLWTLYLGLPFFAAG
jgi:hypothetical protein